MTHNYKIGDEVKVSKRVISAYHGLGKVVRVLSSYGVCVEIHGNRGGCIWVHNDSLDRLLTKV